MMRQRTLSRATGCGVFVDLLSFSATCHTVNGHSKDMDEKVKGRNDDTVDFIFSGEYRGGTPCEYTCLSCFFI